MHHTKASKTVSVNIKEHLSMTYNFLLFFILLYGHTAGVPCLLPKIYLTSDTQFNSDKYQNTVHL